MLFYEIDLLPIDTSSLSITDSCSPIEKKMLTITNIQQVQSSLKPNEEHMFILIL